MQSDFSAVLRPRIDDVTFERLAERIVDVLVVASVLGLESAALADDALPDPARAATVLGQAHAMLRDSGGPALRRLAIRDVGSVRPRPLPPGWRSGSAELTSAVLRHRGPRLRLSDQLRYRALGAARRPTPGAGIGRTAAIPLALWPTWTIRIRPPLRVVADGFRVNAAALVCVVGETATFAEIASYWPADVTRATLSHTLHVIDQNPHAPEILAALTRLADEIDRDGSPIDYRRRRELAGRAALLTPAAFADMCRAGGIPAGGAPKLRAARLWLWETLTGGALHQAPDTLRPRNASEFARYHRFGLYLQPETARLLESRARVILDANGCEREPITWAPRGHGIDLDSLPGPAPGGVDHAPIIALLREHIPPRQVADRAGITLELLRHIIREHPPGVLDGATRDPPSRAVLVANAAPDQLRQLVAEGASLAGLAARFDIGRSVIRAELVRLDIPIPPVGGPTRVRIDPDWLRERYVVQKRPVREIAAEADASLPTILRIVERQGLPRRGRLPRGHRVSPASAEGYPQPLADAVLSPGGVERLRRFQVYARAPALRVASQHLKVYAATLRSQLAALEAVCGGQLLIRRTRNQNPQQLTDLGMTLLRQADKHLGSNPDAPPAYPRPLADVLAAHRGEALLERFTEAAGLPTLTDAAASLGIPPPSLIRTFRRIDAVIGEPVLTDTCRSAPLLLTAVGRLLLRQTHRHGIRRHPAAL